MVYLIELVFDSDIEVVIWCIWVGLVVVGIFS